MVYLIHLSEPYKHAQHYLGFVENDEDVDRRLSLHKKGIGSKFLKAVNKAGIQYSLARLWSGYTRTQERELKNKKHSSRLCPICNPNKNISINNDTGTNTQQITTT